MARPVRPEPKFFLVDQLYERGMDYYLKRWFSDVDIAMVLGEKSTNYLESSTAAKRIYRHLPGVKMVFILREPANRAYSNYLWTRMNGLEHEDFPTALHLEVQREKELPESLRFARPFAYYSRGLYTQMLQPYFNLFPRGRILCLRYEDIKNRSKILAERLYRFLGVKPHHQDYRGLKVINPSKKERREEAVPVQTLQKLRERYAGPNSQLRELLGEEFQVWNAS